MVPGGMSLDLKSLFGLECFYNSRAHGREDQGKDNHTHTTDPPVLAGWDEGRWAIVSHLRSFLSASIGISGHLQLTPRTILLAAWVAAVELVTIVQPHTNIVCPRRGGTPLNNLLGPLRCTKLWQRASIGYIIKYIRRLNPSTEKDPVRIPSVRGSLCWSA